MAAQSIASPSRLHTPVGLTVTSESSLKVSVQLEQKFQHGLLPPKLSLKLNSQKNGVERCLVLGAIGFALGGSHTFLLGVTSILTGLVTVREVYCHESLLFHSCSASRPLTLLLSL